MITSEKTDLIFGAMINASNEIGNMRPEAKGYNYNYIELSAIIEKTKPILAKNGLGVIQLPSQTEPGHVAICTRLIHTSGQWLEDTFTLKPTDMKGVNASQAIGASITYGRRYALAALLQIAADEDTDGLTEHERGLKRIGYIEPSNEKKPTSIPDKKLDTTTIIQDIVLMVNEVKERLSPVQIDLVEKIKSGKKELPVAQLQSILENLNRIQSEMSAEKKPVLPDGYSPTEENKEDIPF